MKSLRAPDQSDPRKKKFQVNYDGNNSDSSN